MEKKLISYSGVVLDEKSKIKLLNNTYNYIPENFTIYAHHMTIDLGELPEEYKKYLGMKVRLLVTDIGYDDYVVAVKVSGFYSKRPTPHITLAVNKEIGGKPFMSNNLTNWNSINNFFVYGRVEEIEFNK